MFTFDIGLMIYYLLLCFRVSNYEQLQMKHHNMNVLDNVKKSCETYTNQNLNGGEFSKTEYYFCNTILERTLGFISCSFQNVKMTSSKNSYLIHSKDAILIVKTCKFNNNEYSDILIYMETTTKVYSQRGFTFLDNDIINCNTRDNDNGRIVLTHSLNNNIQNNYIKFDQSINLGQGFYIYYNHACTFKNNTVINAKCNRGSAFYTYTDNDKKAPQLSDCIFSNCRGTDGSILFINSLKNELILQNITFEKSQNYGNNGGSFIRLETDYNNPRLTVDNCKFRYLESDSNYGGIGLLFYKTSKDKKDATVTFKNTAFEHIYHNNANIGGGAISLDQSNDNKMITYTIESCTFTNITDTHNGGAIYFNSPDKSFNIKSCTFKNTKSNLDGNSIYIQSSKNDNLITISGSYFIDCGSLTNSYVINSNSLKLEFSDNQIIFNDQSKSCGCIKSNQYQDHKFQRNLFKNAHVDLAKNSAGIDESNPDGSNRIEITDCTFDGISGPSEGRCFHINFAQDLANIIINNIKVQNCPLGGILIKLEFVLEYQKFTFNNFQFINNLINDNSFNELQICPQIFIQNKMNGNLPFPITLDFQNCLFQNNKNLKKGGGLAYGKNKFNSNTKLLFNNCHFISNIAEEDGSALYLIIYQGCEINKCEFVKNRSERGSGSIYIETDFESPNTNEKPSASPVININDCTFEDNERKDAGIVINSSPNAPVNIQKCSFLNCGNSGHVISIQSNVQSTIIQQCNVKYNTEVGSGGINIHSTGKIEISNNDFIQTSTDSSLSIKSDEVSETISITQCLFESCIGNIHSCFDISVKTDSFIFKNIVVEKSKLKGCQNYIGSFNLKGNFIFTMTNVSFIDNSCSSLYGGGTGLLFNGISELIFDDCKFLNNEAHQDNSMSRPNVDNYYNGDGGALQIGCHAETAEMKVKFNSCLFQKNKAARHGGALALQTLKEVELILCKFEENIANCNFQSSGYLLYENYFNGKKEGRGGAIYLNPAAGCVDTSMSKFTINECTLSNNNAHDGYAIYVEGDDPGTDFIFAKNIFNDNYNENNYIEDPNHIYGAVITTEILSIKNETLHPFDNPENDNSFKYVKNIIVKELSNVDHSGKTPTYAFTESDYFPSNWFTKSEFFSYSAKFSNSGYFTSSNPFSQSDDFPSTNFFTQSEPFSRTGCFSSSISFSNSNKFTFSDEFTKSDQFSISRHFTSSSLFSKSSYFTQTNQFTETVGFSKSKIFSKSNDFSRSDYFSSSCKFTVSSLFTLSNQFSHSKQFTETEDFSKSEQFSESNDFTRSHYFSTSNKFTESNLFTISNQFSRSKDFTETGDFSESVSFSKSNDFTISDHFSTSNKFTVSNLFTKSNQFSQSGHFTETGGFSKSDFFTISGYFTISDYFSFTNHFTKSIPFSNSILFTQSNKFSETDDFSRSDIFSSSHFFSKSIQFSSSFYFTSSNLFSKSSQFTLSGRFSETNDFSISNIFSISDLFTKSGQFSTSNFFSSSDLFSNTEKFTETNHFSLSSHFSNSYNFTISDIFSNSNHFTSSYQFSNTYIFSETNVFSSTIEFSNSNIFSLTHSFSISNEFSDSKKFSKSYPFSSTYEFSNSNAFSKTQLFSFSVKFTDSNEFSSSHSFSISSSFSNSAKFTKTSAFSNTKEFSHTNDFSFSNKFSKSEDFTQSSSFTPTSHFTNTKIFSKTQQFSNTNKFSSSTKFSYSHSFSNSNNFSCSMKFSETSLFSNTHLFSESKHFSSTESFSSSEHFTKSQQFSESFAFSPSQTPDIKNDPQCAAYDGDTVIYIHDCKYNINNDINKTVYVHVLSSNFSGYHSDEAGSSIYLINTGILCNKTRFIDCVVTTGGGSAIYLKNSFDLKNNGTFIDLLFLRCIADYGGAVYIYSSSDLFDVSFTRCHFQENKALINKNPRGNNDHLYGGSAIFLTCKNSLVINCSFVHNFGGGSVKIYNKFENEDQNQKRSNLEENENKISILGCNFEQDKDSLSSISYIDDKYGNPMEIKECNFKGKLTKGSHYIDGKMLGKEKIRVNSCNFESNLNNSVNLKIINENMVNICNHKLLTFRNMSLILSCSIIITLLFIFMALKFSFQHDLHVGNDQALKLPEILV